MELPILRPFRPEDALVCINRDGWQGVTLEVAREQARHGPAFTAFADGRVIGIAGVLLQWPGVGTAWMALSEGVNGHGLWLTRVVRAVLDDVERAYGLHRMEAVALQDSPRNIEWLEGLGFRQERDGVAQHYTASRQNMIRFERIRQE